MSDMPVPERREAMLIPNLRDTNGRPLAPTLGFTRHRYSHTEQHDFDGGRKHADSPEAVHDYGYRHIFECTKTGATRVYGCEGPNTPGVPDETEEV